MCCFFWNKSKKEKIDKALNFFNNPRQRTGNWQDQVINTAICYPDFAADLLSNTKFLNVDKQTSLLSSANVAAILKGQKASSLKNLLKRKDIKSNLTSLLTLSNLVVISEVHPNFFIQFLDLKKLGWTINAFNAENNSNFSASLKNAALTKFEICKALRAHNDLWAQIQGEHVKLMAKKYGKNFQAMESQYAQSINSDEKAPLLKK